MLRIAMVLATTALVAVSVGACGGGDSDGSSSETSQSSMTAKDVEGASGGIKVVGWQFYESPKAQDEDGVESEWSYVSGPSDLYVAAREGDADVISAGTDSMPGLIALDALASIDTGLISSYESLTPELRDSPAWRNGDDQVVAIPFAAVPTLTVYDSGQVPEPKTLDALLDPAYEQSIGIYDDPITIAQIAAAQGVEDTSEMTQEDLDRAMEMLEQMKPNIKTFFDFGEDTQLFNRGDIKVSIGSFGTSIIPAFETNPDLEFNFVGEATFVDAWSIVGDPDNAPAIKWIDGTLDKDGQDAIVEASGSIPANPAAMPAFEAFDDPVTQELAKIGLDGVLREAPIMRGYATESDGDIVTIDEATAAWNDFRASF